MSSRPQISILIPLFNREDLIKETLNSILGQSFVDWECIVVDDGSTDNSWEVVSLFAKDDKRIHCYKRPDTLEKGANSCRNFGFTKAKGEYVQWFDSDDVMLPNKLEAEHRAIVKDNADYCISLATVTDENLNVLHPLKFQLDTQHTVFKNYAMGAVLIITQMVLWRASFVKGKTLFKPFIKRGQETEVFSRLFFESKNYALVTKENLLYRQHADSKTTKNKLSYVPAYKYSQAYISLQFMELGQQINDTDITKRYDNFCRFFLYEASIARDRKTISLLKKGLVEKGKDISFGKVLKWNIGISLLKAYGKKSNRIQNVFFN